MAKQKLRAVDFKSDGNQIILPTGMPFSVAIEALQRKQKEEEQIIALHEEIECFPIDGAHALMQVLKARYGWASPVPTPGFFGPNPPVMVDLEIAFGVHTQVIWGSFDIPGIEGRLQTQAARNNQGRFVFVIAGQVKKKYERHCKAIADSVREYLKEGSVYKAKAIRLNTNDEDDVDENCPPRFLDLSNVREEELIYSEMTAVQVKTSLFTPIEHSEACRNAKIPLKRGILFEGPYGVGKTLTAYVTAKKCVENKWTFIYLDKVSAIDSALSFAKSYMPAVIFAEDVDRVVSGEERTVDLDDVLNSIDGIEAKNSEIMVVLTTNHVENINKAMLRPGRLDAVISVTTPDKLAAEKLIRLYARNLISDSEDLGKAADELQGQIPAVIREVVERSKLYAISRINGNEGTLFLSCDDLTYAAKSMKGHLALLNAPKADPMTTEERFGKELRTIVEEATTKPDMIAKEVVRILR